MAAKKYVYQFEEAFGLGKELLGGKGTGLAEMTHIGIPIPQGFTISTEACNLYYENAKKVPSTLVEEIRAAVEILEKNTKKNFGGSTQPLLVSIRSGARVSMPGMMDTILNLGLNDVTCAALIKETGNERFALDCYRRFILMFTNIAKGISRKEMDEMLEHLKKSKGYETDQDIPAADLKELIVKYKAYYKAQFGTEFPTDPYEQLLAAVLAIFQSWDNPRAIIYRRMNNIPSDWGTAVNVQSMVFGNKGNNSGTGVGFSRSPATGEKQIFAEYLINAQGEDVVAGIRTPEHIETLAKDQPKIYKQLIDIVDVLEKNYKDMQDMEFTIEEGKLYFLQTRNGKRTAAAALKIACDLVDEGLLTEEQAILKVEPKSLDSLLHPSFDPAELKKTAHIASGLPASPGAATGSLAFTAESAKARAAKGEKVLLIRSETSPEDIEGMVSAQGILTMRGGMTSHAAVVARGMGKCCITGCGAAHINEEKETLEIAGKIYHAGDVLSIDGSTGLIYAGNIAKVEATLSGNFGRIMEWADKFRTLSVRANADSPKDAVTALKFGAEGIGLCRTEHMFFEKDRIFSMRKMILADNVEAREKALSELLPIQRKDFFGLFSTMKEKHVNIRLLDPPLHEFLPQEESAINDLAKDLGIKPSFIHERIEALHEFNPMMGHRGCRLDVSYPEIGRMQARAIIEAAILAQKELGIAIIPEIMIPLVLDKKELKFVKKIVVDEVEKVIAEAKVKMEYKVGTMIEIPRAALLADEIAEEAAFFSFGTNDLTQMTYGFSRDDAAKFLPDYYDSKIFDDDPFQTVDQNGVGKLIEMAVKLGRKQNPKLKIGVCGEHGGDPKSIEFFHNVGLDYVSCSPFRVPVARLAAAHAAVKAKNSK